MTKYSATSRKSLLLSVTFFEVQEFFQGALHHCTPIPWTVEGCEILQPF
jgi:hypothetical protein